MRVLLVLLLLAPLAQGNILNPDGDHEAILHMHLDGRQEIQLSPMPPPIWYEHDRSQGGLSQSACADTPVQGFTNQQAHTWYAAVAPRSVAYDDAPLPPTQRGIMDDLRLSGAPIVLQWFMRASVSDAEAAAPQVVLRATLREGDDTSIGNQAMNAGRIVAQAETEPADLSPMLTGHPEVTYHEASRVYAFRLELMPEAPWTIPRSESFNLRIDVFFDEPVCPEGRPAMAGLVSAVSIPEFRPTLAVGLRNPAVIDRLSAVVDGDTVQLQADVRAVFGSGDAWLVDDAFVIQGPGTSNVTTAWNGEATDRVFPARPGGSYQATANWTYPPGMDGLFNATLTVRTESGGQAIAVVPFGLGSAEQACTVLATGDPSCSVEPAMDKRSPMVSPLLLALALLRRR